mgnify:CR=1 FL=1|jgi:hypothetical protein
MIMDAAGKHPSLSVQSVVLYPVPWQTKKKLPVRNAAVTNAGDLEIQSIFHILCVCHLCVQKSA